MEKGRQVSDYEMFYKEELQNFIAKVRLILVNLNSYKKKANPESLHIARQMVFLIFELASKEIYKVEEALKVNFEF